MKKMINIVLKYYGYDFLKLRTYSSITFYGMKENIYSGKYDFYESKSF